MKIKKPEQDWKSVAEAARMSIGEHPICKKNKKIFHKTEAAYTTLGIHVKSRDEFAVYLQAICDCF